MVGIRCWIRASRDAEVRFPSWKISPPCSPSFEVCRWGLKPHGVNILVELSVWGMPSCNRDRDKIHHIHSHSCLLADLNNTATNESFLFTKLTCSLLDNLHISFIAGTGRPCLKWAEHRKWDILVHALGQKMAAALDSPPVKSVCEDSLFTAFSGQAHAGEDRFLGFEFSRFLNRVKQFVWNSALLRMRQGEFRVRGREKGCHLELAWDGPWRMPCGSHRTAEVSEWVRR